MTLRQAFLTGALAAASFCVAGRAQEAGSQLRLIPSEIDALSKTGSSAGTSGVSAIQTRVLKGDPTRAALYTIQLLVPANTRRLKALPPGSFYTEPPNEPHFARTGNTAVVVQITGFGPTGTRYTEALRGAPPILTPLMETKHVQDQE